MNGNPIPPTVDVRARPGDVIEAEIQLSGWGQEIASARGYETRLLLRDGAGSGSSGTVLPSGWDAPLFPTPCETSADCPPEYHFCYPKSGECVGPHHSPDSSAFITKDRPDFILSGFATISAVANLRLVDYRFFAFAEDRVGVPDLGTARYGGTVIFVVSEDACGTFTFRHDGDYAVILDPQPDPYLVYPALRSLRVHVCEDDGLFCNGLESCDGSGGCFADPPNCDDGVECTVDQCNEGKDSCDHLPDHALCDDDDPCTADQCTPSGCVPEPLCGACCDQWIGDCEDAVLETSCNCPNCAWSRGQECADIECIPEFVPIPTMSDWGLVVLTLLLLSGAKVHFNRRLTANSAAAATTTTASD